MCGTTCTEGTPPLWMASFSSSSSLISLHNSNSKSPSQSIKSYGRGVIYYYHEGEGDMERHAVV
jgi:hypothetical protein